MSEPTATTQEYSEWLTTSQAAASLGCAERTVQRRCKSGKIAARLVTTGDGQEWRIDPTILPAGAIGAATVPTGAANVPPQVPPPIHARNDAATVPSGGSVPTGGDTPNIADLLAQSREEVLFLRGLIEQRDRDAAELRAALRESLRAMPKAITGGEVGSTPTAENQSRENATEAARSIEVGQPARSTPNASQRKPQRPARPLWKVILGIR